MEQPNFKHITNYTTYDYTGKGWNNLILECLKEVEALAKEQPSEWNLKIEIAQIKEKFGSLIIYFNIDSDLELEKLENPTEESEKFNKVKSDIYEISNKYYHLSNQICEKCGSTENVTRGNPEHKGYQWIKTYCKTCHQLTR